MEEQIQMDKKYATQTGRRKQAIWIVALAVAAFLTGCGGEPAAPAGTTAVTTTASTTTLPPDATSETAPAATTVPVVRALDGPGAVSEEWILRTGETRRLTEPGDGRDLLTAWVEIENVGDRSLTVSSLLSVELADKVSGEKAEVPDLVDILTRISAEDPGCTTLDGDIPPGGRLSGWIYGEFPAGTGEITVTVTPDATQDETAVESLQVDLIYQ
jgi:hypothetical protein